MNTNSEMYTRPDGRPLLLDKWRETPESSGLGDLLVFLDENTDSADHDPHGVDAFLLELVTLVLPWMCERVRSNEAKSFMTLCGPCSKKAVDMAMAVRGTAGASDTASAKVTADAALAVGHLIPDDDAGNTKAALSAIAEWRRDPSEQNAEQARKAGAYDNPHIRAHSAVHRASMALPAHPPTVRAFGAQAVIDAAIALDLNPVGVAQWAIDKWFGLADMTPLPSPPEAAIVAAYEKMVAKSGRINPLAQDWLPRSERWEGDIHPGGWNPTFVNGVQVQPPPYNQGETSSCLTMWTRP